MLRTIREWWTPVLSVCVILVTVTVVAGIPWAARMDAKVENISVNIGELAKSNRETRMAYGPAILDHEKRLGSLETKILIFEELAKGRKGRVPE